MRYIVLINLFLCLNAFADGPSMQLVSSCIVDGGRIVSSLTCPTSGRERDGYFCKLDDGRFYNGCTASVAGYGETFFEACKTHDHCYHHEPISTGRSKEECDDQLYIDMLSICESTDESFTCELMAAAFYQAVDKFGDNSWQCSDTLIDY